MDLHTKLREISYQDFKKEVEDGLIDPITNELNLLIFTCMIKKWNIAELILSITKRDINKTDEYGFTTLMYALKHNKYDFAMMLLDYGFNNFSVRNNDGYLVLNYINDDNFTSDEILNRILNKQNQINEEFEFKIYQRENISTSKLRNYGGYGDLFYDKNSNSMVKSSYDKSISSLIRELFFLRIINNINPKLTCLVKGICIDTFSFSIILEELHYSLYDVFSIYKNIDIAAKKNYFKSIYNTLLENIDKIHTIGILHRDLKPSNVMIDRFGHVKIIDFGLSEYICIKKNLSKPTGTDGYIAPDSDYIKTIKIGLEYIELPNNKYNYTFDIFSFGVIIICSIFNKKFSLLFHNDIPYKYKTEEQTNGRVTAVKLTHDEIQIIESFSPHLMDLFKCIFNIDSNIRKTAKELLKHQFFEDFDHSNLQYFTHCREDDNISRISGQIFTEDDIRFDRGTLKYGFEIYQLIKSLSIPVTNVDDENMKIINDKFNSYNFTSNFPLDFDLEFNRNIYLTSVSKNFNKEILNVFINRSNIHYNDENKKSLELMINDVNPILISSFIEYYVTRLQKSNIISTIIIYFRTIAYSKFYAISLTKREVPIIIDDLMREIIDEVSYDKNIILPIL